MSLHTGLDEIQAAELPHFSIAAIIGRSVWILIWNFIPFIGMAIVISVPFVALLVIAIVAFPLNAGIQLEDGRWVTHGNIGLPLVYAVLAVAPALMVQAAVAYRTFHSLSGRRASFGACLTRSLAVLLHLGEASILAIMIGALVAIVGLWLFNGLFVNDSVLGLELIGTVAAILGLFVLTVLWVALPAMVIERIGPVAAILRSWRLTQSRRWHILAVILIFSILEGVFWSFFVFQLDFTYGLLAIHVPYSFFSAIVMTASYYHLVGEKEGITRLSVIFA